MSSCRDVAATDAEAMIGAEAVVLVGIVGCVRLASPTEVGATPRRVASATRRVTTRNRSSAKSGLASSMNFAMLHRTRTATR